MTTPVVTKNDNNNTLHVKHEQVDPNIGQMTPKQNSSHIAVADGMFLSPFFLSPESKLATISGCNINIGDSSLDAVAKSDFEKQDFSDSATFDGQYSKFYNILSSTDDTLCYYVILRKLHFQYLLQLQQKHLYSLQFQLFLFFASLLYNT